MKKRTYEASNAAKRQICTVLKELMTQKPLNRITVAEIMRGCGMARQHFYYHFDDVYDAVRWIFEEEAVALLREHEGVMLWQDGLLQLFPAPAELLAARLHMGVEHAAFGRELHAAPVADEQTAAQLALQGRHGARYRGLAGEQHGRRPAEIAAARHLVEYPAKLPVQLHALSCYAFLIYLRYQLSILPYQGPLL